MAFVQRHDGHPVTVGQGHRLFLIDHDGLAGLDGQHAAAGLVQRFDGVAPDRRHVEAHVLLRLGHLDHGETAGAAQLAGAGDGPVGPFDGLHRKDRALLDGHALADVEPADLAGQAPAELNIRDLGGRRWPPGE